MFFFDISYERYRNPFEDRISDKTGDTHGHYS